MSARLTDTERRVIRHCVGYDAPRGKQGYRNRYCAPSGSDADIVWRGLVARGLAKSCYRASVVDNIYYATADGARAAGLSEAAIVRACGTDKEQSEQREKYTRANARRRKADDQ